MNFDYFVTFWRTFFVNELQVAMKIFVAYLALVVGPHCCFSFLQPRIPARVPFRVLSKKEETAIPRDGGSTVPFLPPASSSSSSCSIDCFVESSTTIEGQEYVIGSPCDNPVSLCSFVNGDMLVEVEGETLERIFPVGEREERGERREERGSSAATGLGWC